MSVAVSINQGKLRGSLCESVLGTSYFSFKGIPFAAPPLGLLRFKDPEPPASWTGVRDAGNIEVNCCVHLDDLLGEIVGSEDSLYLNVYTPSVNGNKAVIVYIHGGAYIKGSGIDKFIGPDYFMDKDIVFVTMNYRLGVLGFFNLDDEVAAGNQGLKDQVAALKWVQENISHFGGNANNVTIYGNSSGAACVHMLTISPMTKGLIHKAIISSGTMTCPWNIGLSKPENCFKIASFFGFKDSKDPKEVVEFLRTVPARQLIEAQFGIIGGAREVSPDTLILGCAIDAKSKNPLFPRALNELLKNDADTPIMIGYTDGEYLMYLKNSSDEDLKNLDQKLKQYIEPLSISREPEKIDQLMKDIRNYYFGNDKPISKEDIPSLINLLSDIFFRHPINVMVDDRRNRKCAQTYLYKFSYVGDEETKTQLLREFEVQPDNLHYFPKGASHADELSYLFYMPLCKTKNPLPPAKGTEDRNMIERLTYLWSNFAKTGNPTSSLNEYINTTWTPVSKDTLTYFEIKDLTNCQFEDKLTEMIEKNA